MDDDVTGKTLGSGRHLRSSLTWEPTGVVEAALQGHFQWGLLSHSVLLCLSPRASVLSFSVIGNEEPKAELEREVKPRDHWPVWGKTEV